MVTYLAVSVFFFSFGGFAQHPPAFFFFGSGLPSSIACSFALGFLFGSSAHPSP